jgi:hypothetical protein
MASLQSTTAKPVVVVGRRPDPHIVRDAELERL